MATSVIRSPHHYLPGKNHHTFSCKKKPLLIRPNFLSLLVTVLTGFLCNYLVIGNWTLGIWARQLTDLLEWPPNNSFPGCNFQCLYNKSTFIESAIYSDLRGRRLKGMWREGKGREDWGETERAPSPLTFLSYSVTPFLQLPRRLHIFECRND